MARARLHMPKTSEMYYIAHVLYYENVFQAGGLWSVTTQKVFLYLDITKNIVKETVVVSEISPFIFETSKKATSSYKFKATNSILDPFL